jgi:fructokinase
MRSEDKIAPFVAGIELGGTKAIAVLGQGGKIVDQVAVPTSLPIETLAALARVLAGWREQHHLAALGIAAFGPIALDRHAPDYGRLLATPKSGWVGADVVSPLVEAAGAPPVLLHTDVTGAALAEGRWGSAQGLTDYVYVTIGTGIGMGLIVNGAPVIGRLHPEAGHMRVRRAPGDPFAGICPFHGDCLEGLASGPAIAARAGAPANTLAADNPIWNTTALALAEGFATLFLTLAPATIIVGGGLGLGRAELLPLVRRHTFALLGGYLPFLPGEAAMEQAIRAAGLGGEAGVYGALALAERALADGTTSR